MDPLNRGYAWQLLEDYLRDPASVDPRWHDELAKAARTHPHLVPLLGPDALALASPKALPIERADAATAAAMALVKAYRTHGHLAARLDPLGAEQPAEPSLDPLHLEPPLTLQVQRRIPARMLRVHVPGETLADVIPALEAVYCGTMAYEIEHISDHEERVWLREAIESGRFRRPLSPAERSLLLARLAEVEAFERYLHRTFLGQKQFSIEGLDVLVPLLDEAIELAAAAGAYEVVIGMAHRGRLNVLAHVIGRPYLEVLREFEGERHLEAIFDPTADSDSEGGSGDVKYHLGAEGVRNTKAGQVRVVLAANPSHLEAVDPVVEGYTRAEQTDRSSKEGRHETSAVLPVLIHGDASFAAQGVVAETLNLESLAGYSTGGTLHVIANNQVGFTTDPEEGRSTRYASDLAKGFDVPIVHVNADDPEAAISAARLALAYRERFGRDLVIDLVGYRRFGHNEQDEPAYTQPVMSERIAAHPPVRALYGDEESAELLARAESRVKEAHESLRGHLAPERREGRLPPATRQIETAFAADRLRQLNEELRALPADFQAHPKLLRQLERRRVALDEGGIDWGQAEELAFASLLATGLPVRLTGQDTARGTFSHRHAVLHAQSGETYIPLASFPSADALFEVYNSPLSEYAALGFEYGYSTAAPEALVLWEAQFGDFINGAQIIVDQFLVAGLSKWRQTSRLTLLLPHGYEGSGPEHSSARLERFLQLAAQNNIRVVNPTTAAQYFHLLRLQALELVTRPLIVMTPKGLLRLKEATSSLTDLAEGRFQRVIDDPLGSKDARRLILCSGKVYYDLQGHETREEAPVAVCRVEQLYPFPLAALRELLDRYPDLTELVWAQEEPQNMGPWRSIRHRLEEATQGRLPLLYAGRSWKASPSEGYPTTHLVEQERIVRRALDLDARPQRPSSD